MTPTFITIALNDLKAQVRDVASMVLLFVVPVAVITIASFALSDLFRPGGAILKVPVVNLDNGDHGAGLVAEFKAVGAIEVQESADSRDGKTALTVEQARRKITAGECDAVVVIPPGFSAAVGGGPAVELLVLQDPAAPLMAGLVRGMAEGAAARVATGTAAAAAPPGVTVRTENVQSVTGRAIDPFKQNVPGYAVMFAMFSMLMGSVSMLREKQSGTLRRMLAAPVSRASILAGKMLPGFITAFTQVAVFFAFGRIVFGMELGNSIAGLTLMAAAVALTTTCMGLLIVTLVKTDGQLASATVLVVVGMSSLGGSTWPLEIVPDFMRKLAHVVTINAWAMDGFKDLLWYGKGLIDVLPEAGTLVLISGLVFGIGLARFRFE